MAALATRKVDWARKHEHYVGPLTLDALLAALDDKQRHLPATRQTVNIDAIDSDSATTSAALNRRREHNDMLPVSFLNKFSSPIYMVLTTNP